MKSIPFSKSHSDFGFRISAFLRPSDFGLRPSANAFTLVELMLVMAVLTIAVCITAPSLSHFFRGRSLDSQARMLLGLTRHGQSRAVADGLPIELWVDAPNSTIGLEAEPSYEQTDAKALEFTLESNMRIEVVDLGLKPASGLGLSPATGTASTPKVTSRHAGLPRIRFLPDGSLDENSPQMLQLTSAEGDAIWIAQSRSRLNYEIRTSNKP
jgi:prepilin-type N-terminal cleavage/methylation domain-containing protein